MPAPALEALSYLKLPAGSWGEGEKVIAENEIINFTNNITNLVFGNHF